MFFSFRIYQGHGQVDMGWGMCPLSLISQVASPDPTWKCGVTSIRKLESHPGSVSTGNVRKRLRSGARVFKPSSLGSQTYLTGFIGAANISDANASAPRTDREVVPEAATRPSTENQDHHTGRGGEGNVQRAHKEGDEKGTHKGLADKLKAKVMGVLKK